MIYGILATLKDLLEPIFTKKKKKEKVIVIAVKNVYYNRLLKNIFKPIFIKFLSLFINFKFGCQYAARDFSGKIRAKDFRKNIF